MPGPDILYVLTESITKGAKTGTSIASGLISGILVHTTAAATGLSLLVYQSATVFQIVKYLGAIYLFYLAYQAFKEKPGKIDLTSQLETSGFNFLKLWRKGFLMNVLNPKVSIFFIAFLPQFVTPNGFPAIYQMIILGVIFMIQGMLIFTIVAHLSGMFAKYLQAAKFWQTTKWIKVVVLSLIGISIAFSKKQL